MADFTGGCCETYELEEYNIIPPKVDPAQLHKTLVKSFNHGAIAGASIEIAGKEVTVENLTFYRGLTKINLEFKRKFGSEIFI